MNVAVTQIEPNWLPLGGSSGNLRVTWYRHSDIVSTPGPLMSSQRTSLLRRLQIPVLTPDFRIQFLDKTFCHSTKQNIWGTRYRSWLRLYATSRKVTGSIPDGAIWFIFNLPNSSSCNMTQCLTQSLTEMSSKNLHGGKACRRLRLTTSQPSMNPLFWKFGILHISHLYGLLESVRIIDLEYFYKTCYMLRRFVRIKRYISTCEERRMNEWIN
jgi:hypothetical protein